MSLPVITPDAAAQPGALHLGRSWAGTALEDACPCTKGPCGLAISESAQCPEHSFAAAKTIRQAHLADACPDAAPTVEAPVEMQVVQ